MVTMLDRELTDILDIYVMQRNIIDYTNIFIYAMESREMANVAVSAGEPVQ